MAGSRNFLVVFNETDISTFDNRLNERKHKWINEEIVDICFASPNIGFILLTETRVFVFSARNQEHECLTAIQKMEDYKFSTCTSNQQSLLLAYKRPGTPIDEWHIDSWKRVTRYRSPDTCTNDEYINCLRYGSDLSKLGMTIYGSHRIRFELRDSKMNCLQRIPVCETGCCGFISMPGAKWLLSDGHFLYVITEDGSVEIIERQSVDAAYNDTGNVTVFADTFIVLRSRKALYFYANNV
ncbi:unnamed protein product [Didymodactylos carnosus]|uniref:Uncharacterized protein n=1 Tax=Didymodactylos carnosus TaxID=1234261 RepID=A0A815EFN4_9BILA|nr:unnamed protein product [Didymodactylos carnosus]CAF1315686.1 unnamed protein product [Didymodactylos carnosus]CAF4124520.1 unnamed protein product [Didymodactylos carnosus]CAF4154407.1 unnamed protein product [Didymodactylos carnosus]